MLNASILKISVGQTNTQTHTHTYTHTYTKRTTITLATCAPRVN